MELGLDVLRVVNLLASALMAGGQMFCLVAVLPAMPGWPPAMSARVHADALTDRPDRVMKVAGVVSVLTALVLVAMLVVAGRIPGAVLTAAGFLSAVLSSFISSREWPINEEIKSWGPEPKLDRYAEMRPVWDRRHVGRTWASLAAFLFFAVAAVFA
jgi:hypothetical protein